MSLPDRLKNPETAWRYYDALAIYNYTRFSEDLYTEAECDTFAKVVENAMSKKRLEKTCNCEGKRLGPEDWTIVLNRGMHWGKKALGKSMLEAYSNLEDEKEKDWFMEGLAESESLLLEAMYEFDLMMELNEIRQSNNSGYMFEAGAKQDSKNKPMTPEEKAKAQKIKEMEEKAKKEKHERMKKRIKKAAIAAAGVAAFSAACGYAGYKTTEIRQTKEKSENAANIKETQKKRIQRSIESLEKNREVIRHNISLLNTKEAKETNKEIKKILQEMIKENTRYFSSIKTALKDMKHLSTKEKVTFEEEAKIMGNLITAEKEWKGNMRTLSKALKNVDRKE